jgi:hypothetical protein
MKAKKLYLPFIILIVLVMYVVYLMQSGGGNNQPFSDFEVADTAAVSKITISRTTGETVTLNRNNTNKVWMVEGTENEANTASINLLMKTFAQWKVLQDIEESKHDFTIRLLSTKHSKIQLYEGNDSKPFKTIYLGDHNPSMTGNFALLQKGDKKSSVPYLINLPGFYGTLETRFFADPLLWRSTRVMELEARDIAKIELKSYESPSESYTINIANDIFDLRDANNNPIKQFDTLSVRRHLVSFKQLYFENYVSSLKPMQRDSIISSTPMFELSVTTTNNNTKHLKIYCKKPITELFDSNNQPLTCDPERMYALIDNKDFVIIQLFGWGVVFKPLRFFTEL